MLYFTFVELSVIKSSKNYVDSAELESIWTNWLNTDDQKSWDSLQDMIYQMCKGVAVHFNPKDEEEHLELSHETFILTMDKIRNGKLKFTPGQAPVFNLLTTTIFRHLYSFMNKKNRRRRALLTNYLKKPGVLDKIIGSSDISGNLQKHPESNVMLPDLLAQIYDPNDK